MAEGHIEMEKVMLRKIMAGCFGVMVCACCVASCSGETTSSGNPGGAGGAGGSGQGGSGAGDSSVGGTGQGGTGQGGEGGVAGSGGGGGSLLIDTGTGGADADFEGGACAAASYKGVPIPLDVYVLLDATASMNGASGTPVVWPTVVGALNGIISDPKSSGIGMGITFLPVAPPPGFKIPGTCAVSADCPGATGPCEAIASGVPKACSHACTPATVLQDCGMYGECTSITGKSVCNGALVPTVSCDPADYGKPVVPIGTLPANQAALSQAIGDKNPDGDATPTQPALQGALTYAKTWRTAHPDHLVYVLFATDGLPNNCTSNSVQGAADIAKQHFEETPSVPTFVLGLGDLKDLNTIAAAGGTSQAVLADSSSTAQKLLDLFNQIRGNGECKFSLPDVGPGTIDFGAVNVRYTPAGQSMPIMVGFVGDSSQCDPVQGGWFYASEPGMTTPTQIVLCPTTCQAVSQGGEGVEILIGCKTILQ